MSTNVTAADAFTAWAAAFPDRPVVWLDSAMPHGEIGRKSIVSACPVCEAVVDADGRMHTTIGGQSREHDTRDFFELLDQLTRSGGGTWIGWLGYDLKNQIERLPGPRPDETGLPRAWFGCFPSWLEVDHGERGDHAASTAIAGLRIGPDFGPISATAHAHPLEQALAEAAAPPLPAVSPSAAPVSDFASRAEYEATIARAIEYVHAGDIFQANIAQRFRTPYPTERPALVALYLRLRAVNPAPFGACILLPGGRGVLSSSPERFLRIDGRRLESRPIKGTRARLDHDDAGNARRRAELLASEKDRAELSMIVDLVRNDMGKVSEAGSVRVTADAALEEYATVYHLVSTVESRRRADATIGDCLRAAFPGGSITGAPKIRAMEIIDELEPVARGAWTGSIGYIRQGEGDDDNAGGGAQADFNIAIRTISAGNHLLTFHAGGGIVADSSPADEYDETIAKARGLLRALQIDDDPTDPAMPTPP